MTVAKKPPYGSNIAPFPGVHSCTIEVSNQILFSVFGNGSQLPGLVSFLLGHITSEISALSVNRRKARPLKLSFQWGRKPSVWTPEAFANTAY